MPSPEPMTTLIHFYYLRNFIRHIQQSVKIHKETAHLHIFTQNSNILQINVTIIICITWPQWVKQGKSEGFDSCDRPSNLSRIGFKSLIFQPVWPCRNNRAPLLCYFKLCAAFRSHWWIQTGVTVRKRLIWVKIDDFFNCVTLKFDVWPWKTIGHLFYATWSFVQHFVAIGEFKLE